MITVDSYCIYTLYNIYDVGVYYVLFIHNVYIHNHIFCYIYDYVHVLFIHVVYMYNHILL